MKVLYIDPWFARGSNLYYYSSGLAESISKHCDLTVVCAKNAETPRNAKYCLKKVFFQKSNEMKRGLLRGVVRGFEYINAYRTIKKMAKHDSFDVIHIEWLLLYKFDFKTLKFFKKHCHKLILKAHNVLPHENGKKYINVLRKIYSIPDIILLHGENLANEFSNLFPSFSVKTRIQRHGVYLNHNRSFDVTKIEKNIVERIEKSDRIYLFFGRITYEKGVERLLRIWKKCDFNSSRLLIIAGKIGGDVDCTSLNNTIETAKNVLFIEGFISDNLLNYLVNQAHLVLIPYLKGSMSGVVFTASEFSKPVFATDFGSITEYLLDKKTGFICENDEQTIYERLVDIDNNYSNEKLRMIGINNSDRLNVLFNWNKIGKDLVDNVYSECLRFTEDGNVDSKKLS